MLQSVRKAVSMPELPVQTLLSAGVLLSFLWLVVHNRIHPVVIYFLQLYLQF